VKRDKKSLVRGDGFVYGSGYISSYVGYGHATEPVNIFNVFL
jgi:hypothetical protein